MVLARWTPIAHFVSPSHRSSSTSWWRVACVVPLLLAAFGISSFAIAFSCCPLLSVVLFLRLKASRSRSPESLKKPLSPPLALQH